VAQQKGSVAEYPAISYCPHILRRCFHSAREQSYDFRMTKLLDQALEAVRVLPPETQDGIARLVLQLARDDAEPVALSPDERAAISVSKIAAARGEFATDEQVRETWAKRGL
jgi:hypothetical protein